MIMDGPIVHRGPSKLERDLKLTRVKLVPNLKKRARVFESLLIMMCC
jgi:hypothetical protein